MTSEDTKNKEESGENSTDYSSELDNTYLNPGQAHKKTPDSSEINDLYRATNNVGKDSKPSKIKKLAQRRGFKFAGIGGGILAIVVTLAALTGFLNVFQLDHLMTNIESKSFIRHKASMDMRSDRWIRTYILIRLGEIEKGNVKSRGNIYFHADKVDTDNPFTDWYKTLRASRFEEEVFNKHGIAFRSTVDTDGKIKFAKITFPDQVIEIGDESLVGKDYDQVDLDTYSKKLGQQIDVKIFDDSKSVRKEVKRATKESTHWWQVTKRRHMRKAIYNTTGIREWRFFETTREKVRDKKLAVRNRFITKILPSDTKIGKVAQCLFGILTPAQCSGGDAGNPNTNDKNMSTGNPDADNEPDKRTGTYEETDIETEKRKKVSKGVDISKVNVKLIGRVVGGVFKVTNAVDIFGFADAIANIIDSLSNIKGFVVAFKAAQAVTVFANLNIMRDQIKTGEVTSDEVSQAMSMLNNIAANEGYSTVISGKSSNVQAESNTLQNAKDKEEYCSEEYQDKLKDPKNAKKINNVYHYLCPEKQIGGLSGAATGIDAFFNSPWGKVVKKIADFWNTATDNFFGDFLTKAVGAIDFISEKTIAGVFYITGTDDNIAQLMKAAMTKLTEAVGITPLVEDNEDSPIITGQVVNAAVQGGAATNETTMRYAGANKTTNKTRTEAVQRVAHYNNEQTGQQSLFERYASLENPDSFTSKNLSSFAQVKANITSIFSRLILSVGTIFNPGQYARAATASGYTAAEFAGIDTYDYPSKCLDADPLTMTPQNSTNVVEILQQHGKSIQNDELTWDLVTDSDAFYEFIYQKLDGDDNADEIAMQIYNCALLDNDVRGGLGALYGYDKDHALTAAPVGSISPTGTAGANGWSLNDMISYSQCDLKWISTGFGSYGTICTSGCGITSIAMAIATLNGDENINPATMAKRYGAYHTIGTSWALLPIAAKDYGLKSKEIGTDLSAAKDTLREGGIVIASFAPGTFTRQGHFMIIRAFSANENKFYIVDPYNGRHNGAYTSSYLLSEGNLINMWGYTR